MENRWELLWEQVEACIEPVLQQAGFTRTLATLGEEQPGGHPRFTYERPSDGLKVGVDAIERTQSAPSSAGHGMTMQYLNWIRVDINADNLRNLYPPASSSNIYQGAGWTFTNAQELERSVEEIVVLLRRHFNL